MDATISSNRRLRRKCSILALSLSSQRDRHRHSKSSRKSVIIDVNYILNLFSDISQVHRLDFQHQQLAVNAERTFAHTHVHCRKISLQTIISGQNETDERKIEAAHAHTSYNLKIIISAINFRLLQRRDLVIAKSNFEKKLYMGVKTLQQ